MNRVWPVITILAPIVLPLFIRCNLANMLLSLFKVDLGTNEAQPWRLQNGRWNETEYPPIGDHHTFGASCQHPPDSNSANLGWPRIPETAFWV